MAYNGSMLFTGKGDDGTTRLFASKDGQAKTFGCDQRISKSSAIAEALGSVDELNSLLGVVKMKTKSPELVEGGEITGIGGLTYDAMLSDVQQDLFIAQAQLANALKAITKDQVTKLEDWVNAVEKELPPITSFFVSGGTELAALCDYARTVARRAERRVVEALENGPKREEHQVMLAYMNRLSSLLYAFARLANHRAGIKEEKPHY